jgi:hypothetical protein
MQHKKKKNLSLKQQRQTDKNAYGLIEYEADDEEEEFEEDQAETD